MGSPIHSQFSPEGTMESKGLTRAELLVRMGVAPLAIGAFAALSAEAEAADNKKQFKYQSKPNGGKKCSGCALFIKPAKCQVVTGVISPNGWCTAYAPKAH
jgi:hypothetical protein